MGIIQLYNNNLRKLPNEYGDVSIMVIWTFSVHVSVTLAGQNIEISDFD